MSDVTRILEAVQQGDPRAAEELLPLVYDELRRLAAHKMANEAVGNLEDFWLWPYGSKP
jgi:DNA-binding GntR family transcriptional regulator